MKMTPNIGIVNALIRITCGLTMLSVITSKMVKKPWKQSYWLIAFLSSMKVAEGIVRYCPMTAAYTNGKDMYNGLMDDFSIDEMNNHSENTQSFNPS